jgi:hypothetical protein
MSKKSDAEFSRKFDMPLSRLRREGGLALAIPIGHRSAYRLIDQNGWHADFATRQAALAYCLQNDWHVRASALDRDATVNQFSGGSPPREMRS